MVKRKRMHAVLAVVTLSATAMTGLAGVAAAAGNGGSGGGGETETGTNNLSVPTVFVPDTGAFALSCGAGVPGDLVNPTGEPANGYEIAPDQYFYVQQVNTWQAQCETAPAGTVTATVAWGDNLTGSASKTANKPIRVEVALNDDAVTTMGGFTVVKLEPSQEDRNSAYGTVATGTPGSFTGTPLTPFTSTGVYDSGATLRIYDKATPQSPVVTGPASAEINASGAVVYGYNLNVPKDGYYVIEFSAPNVTLSGADAGEVTGGHLASLTITVGTPPTDTTPTTPTTPPAPTTPAAPSTPVSPTAPASGGATGGSTGSVGSGGTGSATPSTGSGATPRATAAVLATKYRALTQLNKAIATTNASIRKFHVASVFALRRHLAIQPTLARNVKLLENRLHSLLQRRRALMVSLAKLRG